jgi:hypothetical protein
MMRGGVRFAENMALALKLLLAGARALARAWLLQQHLMVDQWLGAGWRAVHMAMHHWRAVKRYCRGRSEWRRDGDGRVPQ